MHGQSASITTPDPPFKRIPRSHALRGNAGLAAPRRETVGERMAASSGPGRRAAERPFPRRAWERGTPPNKEAAVMANLAARKFSRMIHPPLVLRGIGPVTTNRLPALGRLPFARRDSQVPAKLARSHAPSVRNALQRVLVPVRPASCQTAPAHRGAGGSLPAFFLQLYADRRQRTEQHLQSRRAKPTGTER